MQYQLEAQLMHLKLTRKKSKQINSSNLEIYFITNTHFSLSNTQYTIWTKRSIISMWKYGKIALTSLEVCSNYTDLPPNIWLKINLSYLSKKLQSPPLHLNSIKSTNGNWYIYAFTLTFQLKFSFYIHLKIENFPFYPPHKPFFLYSGFFFFFFCFFVFYKYSILLFWSLWFLFLLFFSLLLIFFFCCLFLLFSLFLLFLLFCMDFSISILLSRMQTLLLSSKKTLMIQHN